MRRSHLSSQPIVLALLVTLSVTCLSLAAAGATTAAEIGGCAGTVPSRVLAGDPGTYLGLVATLQAGDLLQLAAGTYTGGLPVTGLAGAEDECITIEGPPSGPPAIFTGRDCCNTVSIRDSSYVVIRHLELDGLGRAGDAVKAESESTASHHVTLEGLTIRGHDADQQIVGINTKSPAWNWVVRGNVIEGTGTGMYFGNSDGEDELVNSLVEHNLVVDTLGYNLQVKHQNGRATGLGMPASGTTIIRHNVFSKANDAATGGSARPNVLLGHWPLSGPGADDTYLVYGNFFYQNPTGEALIQAEGHVALYGNVFVNTVGSAIAVQPHNDVPKRVRIAQNTVLASATGIRVTGGDPGFEQRVIGNAVFAATPLAGGDQADNVVDSLAVAGLYLVDPDGEPGGVDGIDLFPLPGQLDGAPIALGDLSNHVDWNRDWNGAPRPGSFRGAYAGAGTNPGWTLALEPKPASLLLVFADGFETGSTAAWAAATGR